MFWKFKSLKDIENSEVGTHGISTETLIKILEKYKDEVFSNEDFESFEYFNDEISKIGFSFTLSEYDFIFTNDFVEEIESVKCDQCEKRILLDGKATLIIRQGSFDQPLFFCSKVCTSDWDLEYGC